MPVGGGEATHCVRTRRIAPADARHGGAAFPLHRSITGNGVRATLQLVRETLPMTVHEVPSGTGVLDWTVPKEWNVRDAYVADAAG